MLRTKDLNVTLSMSAASIISLSKSCVHSENSRLTPERKTRNILRLRYEQYTGRLTAYQPHSTKLPNR